MAINARKWAKSLGVIALGVLLTNCGDDSLGQLTLSIQSDMKIPEDVDSIRLYVESSSGMLLDQRTLEIGPGRDGLIPMTIALVPMRTGLNPIKIRLFSDEGPKTRTLREAVLSIPPGKNPHLRMPISWLCEGEIDDSTAKEPAEITTSCDPGETCVMGRCVTQEIDADQLDEFKREYVYGGSSDAASGTCFDTLGCFARPQGAQADLDLTDCSVAAPADAGDGTNLAMVLEVGSDGICGPDNCLVPLDEDSGRFPYFVGWQRDEKKARLLLPPAVCVRKSEGRILGVALTTACETKTPAIPTCGPWSSVTSNPGTPDAPGPEGDFGSTNGCGDLTASADSAALCVQLEPEIVAPAVPANPALDGLGDLVVELFDGPDPDASSTKMLDRVMKTAVSILDDPAARNVGFTGIKADEVYVRATFFDNEDETTVQEIQRGGAWRGAPRAEQTDAPLGLQRVALTAGSVSESPLTMQAIRRLNVTVRLSAAGDAPLDGADGPVSWRAYDIPNPGPDDVPTGFSEVACADLGGGPRALAGHVVGAGPHYLVAGLDDFNLALSEFPALGGTPGSLWSGAPGAGDTWDASGSMLQLDAMQYAGTTTLDLGHVVDPGDTLTPSYECPGGGTCNDGTQNGNETDIDCGGTCERCPPGKACAGDGDCAQLVCEERICLEATCNDGELNGNETDIDCGGGTCGQCELDQSCFSGNDCVTGRCITNQCQPATT